MLDFFSCMYTSRTYHISIEHIQSGAAGFDTGNGGKLSNTQAACLTVGLLGCSFIPLHYRCQILRPDSVVVHIMYTYLGAILET